MAASSRPEVWLRGPVPGVPAPLQPVAHAVLQAQEEVQALLQGFPDSLLWVRPAGVASVGFHLQHLAGVLDRLFTYARGEQLTPGQMALLRGETLEDDALDSGGLAAGFKTAVDRALDQLRTADQSRLLEARGVGRAQLPSTVLGLLFHAAEHCTRHVGQAITTAKILVGG